MLNDQSCTANNEVIQANLCWCLKFHNVMLEIGHKGVRSTVKIYRLFVGYLVQNSKPVTHNISWLKKGKVTLWHIPAV